MILARVVVIRLQARPVDLRPVLVPAMLFALALLAVLLLVLLVAAIRSRRRHASRPTAGQAAADDDRRLVRYLDPETRRVVRIPAAELAPGSVLANIRGVGDGIWIAADALKPGPLRHPPFDEAARVPLREIQIALERVCPTTIEEWEDGFRRDTHPGREIALWLHVARTLRRTMDAGVAADVPQREEAIYRVLVACMTGTREHVRHIHGAAGLSAADVERIVENYYRPQATLPPPPP